MSTLSLDLRGPGPSLPQARASGASVSLLVHGVGIGALVLVPLLSKEAPPEIVHAFQAPLVKPITVTLPQPDRPRPPLGKKSPAVKAAAVAAPDLSAPRETPTVISATDLLDPDSAPHPDATASRDGRGGGEGGIDGVECAVGALCGTSPIQPVDPRPAETPRVGGVIREPKLAESRAPQYPPVAQAAGVSGRVILEAHVSENGRVIDVKILEGHALFNEAAVSSVRSRRYEPLLLNGVRSDFLVTITVTFNIRR